MFFFFFKQKTAYEMRISDWSSDVCSSDLPTSALSENGLETMFLDTVPDRPIKDTKTERRFSPPLLLIKEHENLHHGLWRSEEHTSELQSLMRISYAVFCLKKKTKHT